MLEAKSVVQRLRSFGFLLLLWAGGFLQFGWLIWPQLGGIAVVVNLALFLGVGVWEFVRGMRQGPDETAP